MPELESATPNPSVLEDSGGSLAEHEAEFTGRSRRETPATEPAPTAEPATSEDGPTDLELAANPNLAFEKPKERHRAESQKARARDVPRINALTRQNKEWQEKYAALETRLAELEKPKPAPAVSAPPETPSERFTFPTIDEYIAQHPGADYDAWRDAKDDARYAWRQQREQFTSHQARQTADQQAMVARITAQVSAFRAVTPDYDAAVAALKDEHAPDLLMAALIQSDNFPQLVYALAKTPALRHELALLTDGKAVSEANVASVQRLLALRIPAGTTGAVASVPSPKRVSKPPTPVRTGALATGVEPPGDGASLADHEAYYSSRKPR